MTRVTHVFDDVVTADSVEQLLAEIPADQTPREVTLDLRPCRHLSPGAGWRLGNAMSNWSAAGEVSVLIPEPDDFSGSWFLNFTRSGLGLALACHADRIESDQGDVGRVLRDYYAERGDSSGENYAVSVDLAHSRLAVSIDAFDKEIKRLASHVRLDFKALDRASRQALREVCFEAIENVGDHAFRSPWSGAMTPFSYFSLRYHKKIDSINVPGAALNKYLERLPGILPSDRDWTGFVELVVTDNGNGIAQRQSQNPDIYEGPIENEDLALREAFAATGSVKLRASDSFIRGEPGFGFSYIARGLQRLYAYAMLRTGRRLAVLDGSLPTKDPGWAMAGEALPQMPGTTLQILFPLLSAQLHLPRPSES
jgi:hypothetical protein